MILLLASQGYLFEGEWRKESKIFPRHYMENKCIIKHKPRFLKQYNLIQYTTQYIMQTFKTFFLIINLDNCWNGHKKNNLFWALPRMNVFGPTLWAGLPFTTHPPTTQTHTYTDTPTPTKHTSTHLLIKRFKLSKNSFAYYVWWAYLRAVRRLKIL